MAKFFITGATGFIGSYLVRELLGLGHQIKALKRPSSNLAFVQDFAHKIEWTDGDILDVVGLQKQIADVDYVIHAAAVVSFSPKDRKKMYEQNIQGTINMVSVAQKYPIKKFVHISSIAALGRNKNLSVISEETQWEDSDENTEYAITKYQAEMEVWRAAAEGLPVLIVNPSIVLGKGDTSRSSLQIFRFAQKQYPFYPQGSINYVDVRDVASITVSLALSPIINERYILDGGHTTFKDFFTQIATIKGFPPPTIAVSPLLAEIGWRVLAVIRFLTGIEPFLTKETARSAMQNFVYDTQKIRALGFSFRSLEDTLKWVLT